MSGELWCMWRFYRWFLEWLFHKIGGWLLQIRSRFVSYYFWYFHVKLVNVFHVVSFDLIRFYLNRCFKFQFGCFNFSANFFIETCLLKAFFKGYVNCRNMLLFFNENKLKLVYCFFCIFGIFIEAHCFWFDMN